MTTSRKLQRSAEDRLVLGVSGGLAEHFGLDPVAVRIGWLVACLLTAGGAAVVYAGMGLLIPIGPRDRTEVVRPDPRRGAKRMDETNLREEARILLEVRRELGPEYEDEMIDSFLDKINARLEPPPKARRRIRRASSKLLWFSVLVAGLIMFGNSFSTSFGHEPFLRTYLIVALVVTCLGVFQLTRGVRD